jgi:hypothetical protein
MDTKVDAFGDAKRVPADESETTSRVMMKVMRSAGVSMRGLYPQTNDSAAAIRPATIRSQLQRRPYTASACVADPIATDRGHGDRRGENLSARLVVSGRGATVSAADSGRKAPLNCRL